MHLTSTGISPVSIASPLEFSVPYAQVVSGEGVKDIKYVPLLVAEKLAPPSDRGTLVGHF